MVTESWMYQLDAALITAALVLGMLLNSWLGLCVGRRRLQDGADTGAVTTGIFGLLGLLLAFTFGMSGARYDTHRELIVREANAIATAALRADMYVEPDRHALRRDIGRYLEARIEDIRAGFSAQPRISAEQSRERARQAIWERTATLSRDPRNLAASNQMIPAVNQMFDLASERLAAERGHVPEAILGLLFLACLLGTFFAAYFASRAAHFDWLTMAGFIMICAAVVYVALDLERPRRGLIDMRLTNQSMLDVRSLIK